MNEKTTKDKYIHIRIEEGFKNEVANLAKEKKITISTLVNMLLQEWLSTNKKNK